ncbi:MAG: dienelactone hydrolase family protein [Tabrizicola sp.]|uniref:alpha/beta hydrolase n=1 Tax=Tabrizicola sp. TaxID=2005166 RepID=UPI002734B4F6|nr:dienelactone hydrolase family protein [Tabrizicola sp.]MDP3262243.1 dienelactone hydrolase family protein [Tabrizicola sp.]MDP3648010.1 dienelactone hydrolase family protein [Paracoccaceae bacterium]MDZ4065435.1 dienelactone hydrolase family protein [Tabrizicola sp.]
MRRHGPASGARAGIVLAHGRGGSSADILGLMQFVGATDVVALAPDAPGQSWWPTSFLAPAATLAPYVERGVAALMQGVAALEAEGVPRGSIWLGGFSQGAGLALETFARQGDGLAGVFGFSGGLLGTGDGDPAPDAALYGHGQKRFDYAGRRDGAKVWVSVHERDPHIPLKRVKDSVAVFHAMGAEVALQVYPGAGHSVMREDMATLKAWLG